LRKGLFMLGLMVFFIIMGATVITAYYTVGTGRDTTTTGDDRFTLSFKPFTLNQLLRHKVEVDIDSCGKPVHSAKFNLISERTSQIRGLRLKKEVPLVEFSEAAIRYMITLHFAEDESSDEIIGAEKILKALGLMKQAENLQEILTAVLTEQIAGSYDAKIKKITIIANKGLGNATDEITLSHELTHALADENFGLDRPPLDDDAYNGDNDLAVESLVEGDAMDTMFTYAKTYMNVSDLLGIQQESANVSSRELDRAPPYIKRGLLFPYEQGLAFAQKIKESGGEQAIDRAYASPPMSSEQIMHPEKYLSGNDAPRAVDLPDLAGPLGKGWKRIDSDTLGEFDMQVWFEELADMMSAREVPGGWGGNTIQYYQGTGKNYVMPNMTVWDTEIDSQEFFDDYVKLLEGRFTRGLRKIGGTPKSYLYEAAGEFYYCGISGDATLALQSNKRATLNKALKSFPQMERGTEVRSE